MDSKRGEVMGVYMCGLSLNLLVHEASFLFPGDLVARDLKRGEGHESIYVYGCSVPSAQSKGSLAGDIKAYGQFE